MTYPDGIAEASGVHESVSELFHENSKQFRSDDRVADRIIAMTASPALQRLAAARKRYPSARRIALPTEMPPVTRRFDEVVLLRRSVRAFASEPLHLGHLAKLLAFGNGVTGEVAMPDGPRQHFRAAPSGGALYPVELYVASIAADGLEPGVYHYDAVAHALELVRPGRFADALASMTYTPELASSAAAVVLSGVTVKSRIKYGERAYRFLLMEAGHIAQNVLLTATALDLAACPIGGFVDDELDNLLGLDGLDEVSLYLIAVGQRR